MIEEKQKGKKTTSAHVCTGRNKKAIFAHLHADKHMTSNDMHQWSLKRHGGTLRPEMRRELPLGDSIKLY